MLNGVGLVLEGGGMRGVYTAGVLEYFLENGIQFPYTIGVSAGACNAASYLSGQRGRNKTVNIEYISDPRYLSWKNYIRNREIFGMDFIFNELPNKLVPYNYDAFFATSSEFVIGTTDCHTGEPVYFGKNEYGKDLLTVLKASSSLPFIAPEVHFAGRILLDGGISDPIPVKRAIEDGYKKNVVILTRNDGYIKKPSRFHFLTTRKYPQYKGLHTALRDRFTVYNETIDFLRKEQAKGNAFIIRPSVPLKVSRIERNPRKLEQLYMRGYEDAKNIKDDLLRWADVHEAGHLIEN